MQDNNQFGLKSSTKHTIDQAIEVVCFRKETLAAMDNAPAYVWWWFTMDEGELHIHVDKGKLHGVCIDRENWKWRYVAAADDLDIDQLLVPWASDRYYGRDEFISATEEAMIRMGVQPYQKCLSRYREDWSTDYWGESDCEYECELLYVEPLGECTAVYLPIPLHGLGIAPPKTRSVSFA